MNQQREALGIQEKNQVNTIMIPLYIDIGWFLALSILLNFLNATQKKEAQTEH